MVNVTFDRSEPRIADVSIPSEAPTDNEVTISVKIANDGATISAPQSGSCQTGLLGTNVGWWTPIQLVVGGEVIEEQKACIGDPNATKTKTFRHTFDESRTYEVEIRAIREPQNEVADEVAQTVTVSPDASNPAKRTIWDQIKKLLGQFGGGTQGTLVLAAVALGVFMLI